MGSSQKAVYDIRIEARESLTEYKQKKITLWYSIKNRLVDGKDRTNNFCYKDNEDKIDELTKKDQLEIFEFLAEKHLEKNQGYGKHPKQFQTPCYLCNQKTLTTLGWSQAGYPDNLERFFCRLCRTSFSWVNIKDDPVELQSEMRNYYRVFQQKELEKDSQRLKEINEELARIISRIIESRTPI